MSNTCSTETECCETAARAEESCCPTQVSGPDPLDKATEMWTKAFFQAMKEAHVEVLKAKIIKGWGAKLDKSADAVLETMETCWQSMVAQAKAKADLRDRLANAMRESKK